MPHTTTTCICPNCRTRLKIVRVEQPLTTRQLMVRDAIDLVKRDTQQKGATTQALYAYLSASNDDWIWSLRTVQAEMRVLAQRNVVWQPHGRKGGWDHKPDDTFVVVAEDTRRAA